MPSVFPSAREIVRGVIAALVVAAILAIGGALLGVLDVSVPIWALVLAVLLVPVAFVAGQVSQAGDSLEPYYVDHVREILDTLQKVVAGDVPGVTVEDFIERGILAPARQWLTSSADEDVRLSVLVPTGPRQDRFAMALEAGHSVAARQRFDLPIQGSFAGFAFASGEMQWTNDVDADPRWRPHPQARPERRYGSLASVPIRVGDRTVAVLNVISTEKGALLPSELMYIDVLGSIINVVWSLGMAEPGDQEPSGSGDLAAD